MANDSTPRFKLAYKLHAIKFTKCQLHYHGNQLYALNKFGDFHTVKFTWQLKNHGFHGKLLFTLLRFPI